MRIARQFDLITAAGIDKFAQEMILQRNPERINADFGAMTPEDARDVRKVHTEHCVDFLISWRCTEQVQPLLWEHGVRPCAARRCRFQMARGARTSRSSSSQGRGARARRGKRHVQDQVAWCRQHGIIQLIVHSHLCKLITQLVCRTTHYTWCSCACHCQSECVITRHTWCSCTAYCKNEYRDVCAQRDVSMSVLVNAHSCGVSVRRAASAGARRHRTP